MSGLAMALTGRPDETSDHCSLQALKGLWHLRGTAACLQLLLGPQPGISRRESNHKYIAPTRAGLVFLLDTGLFHLGTERERRARPSRASDRSLLSAFIRKQIQNGGRLGDERDRPGDLCRKGMGGSLRPATHSSSSRPHALYSLFCVCIYSFHTLPLLH